MLFNSLIFLFVFLPITLASVYILPKRSKNAFIFLASLIFYAWGNVSYSIILILSILINYFIGLGLSSSNELKRKSLLTIGIAINLSILVFFKYIDFLIENLNLALSGLNGSTMEWESVRLPIGISFFTFQAISYLMDVYRKQTKAQHSFIRLGLFISLFPQLIAGPIVRYNSIEKQLQQRSIGINKLYEGIKRFIIGLGKKVILADTFAYKADLLFSMSFDTMTAYDAWLGIILYSLQIYYDFSGYSDMAIGLGKMMGFNLPENFNFPYIAKSVQEFWRRWHITLSRWFKDYLYIPLGGNRLSAMLTYRNLIVVFLLTGLWHGANWNFVLWGLFHGFFLILERLGLNRILHVFPAFIRHLYLIAVVTMAWVLFRTDNVTAALNFYETLFNFSDNKLNIAEFILLLDNQLLVFLLIGVLAAFPFFKTLGKISSRIIRQVAGTNISQVGIGYLELVGYTALFILVVLFIISSTHQPFIYFQF